MTDLLTQVAERASRYLEGLDNRSMAPAGVEEQFGKGKWLCASASLLGRPPRLMLTVV